MVYKYEKLGEELIKLLKQRKKNREKTTVIRASEVKHLLDVEKISHDLSGYGVCSRQISGKTDCRGVSEFYFHCGISIEFILRRVRLVYENAQV